LPKACPRLWPESTIVCLASGPSLTVEDVAIVEQAHAAGQVRVIAVNTTYRRALWADVLYACDAAWWRWWRGAPDFAGLKFALQSECAKWPGVVVLNNTGAIGLERNPCGLRNGRNSGYQAINLAVHLGARRIILVGYDMQDAEGGVQHWHEPHPNRSAPPYAKCLQFFGTLVEPLEALGVEVVNATRETALVIFPQERLTDALAVEAAA
jgi:hypothetical protein